MRLSLGLSSEDVGSELAASLCGVGMIRGEYVFRRLRQYVTVPAASLWLTSYLEHVATVFAPEPVWYRTSDLEAREVSILEGRDEDIVDRVAMLGTRGIRRAMLLPEAFDRELAAFETAARTHSNLGLSFPYLTEAREFEWAINRARAMGIDAAVGCMAETPAAVVSLDGFIDCGARRIVVGCNDLGALTMGVARGSTRYPPVSSGLARMIGMARGVTERRGIELALAGYLTADHLSLARASGIDECVIHYSDLPGLLGPRFADLPDLGLMAETKQWTRNALKQRERSLGGDAGRGGRLRPERRRWPRPG